MSSTKSPVNIAILVSWRFECLNVLLDILKTNFKEKYITHVFCNLNKEEYEIYQDENDNFGKQYPVDTYFPKIQYLFLLIEEVNSRLFGLLLPPR